MKMVSNVFWIRKKAYLQYILEFVLYYRPAKVILSIQNSHFLININGYQIVLANLSVFR